MDRRKLEVGQPGGMPHFAVIGEPTNFYAWVWDGSTNAFTAASAWITGREAFRAYGHLVEVHGRDREGFVTEVRRLHAAHPKRA